MGAAISLLLAVFTCLGVAGAHQEDAPNTQFTPLQAEMVHYLDSVQSELVQINQDIWGYAELGLQEYRSSRRLAERLKAAGFRVRQGISNMPTAFVAEYGSGK